MNSKAMFQAMNVFLSSIAILLLFLGVTLFFLKTDFVSTGEIIFQKEELQATGNLLSLFQQTINNQPITELLIQHNTAAFSNLLKEVYGTSPKCRLIVDGNKLDVGCKEVDEPPQRLKLEVPYSDQLVHIIIFEVVQ